MKSSIGWICFASLIVLKTCYGQVYVAEGYFVVDDSAVQNYIRAMNSTDSPAVKYQKAVDMLQKDVSYVLSQVNYILTSVFRFGYNVEVRIRRIDILTNNIVNSFMFGSSNTVESYIALDTFQNWLVLQGIYEVVKFDFAMYWTGLNLFDSTGDKKHFDSFEGGICAGAASAAVVEFQPSYRDVVGTVKAIAKLMGASTDSIISTYTSTPFSFPSHPNRWTFSSCSATSIKDFLAQLKNNCLLTTSTLSVKPSVTYTTYTGDLLNPDVICQRGMNDTRSYMCRSLPQVYNYQLPRGNAVCGQIYCRVPSAPTVCAPVYTSDGMICDSQKRCTGGQCLSDSAPYLNSMCIWGDQKILELPEVPFNGTCQNYINQFGPASCYSSPINESCCGTCKNYSTGVFGCEYGDRSTDCVKHTRDEVCPLYKNTLCCAYCSTYFTGKRSTHRKPFPVLKNTSLPSQLHSSYVIAPYKG